MQDIKRKRIMWVNSFIRDFIIALLIGYVQYKTYYNSRMVWFITGMFLVYVSWKLTDLKQWMRRIKLE